MVSKGRGRFAGTPKVPTLNLLPGDFACEAPVGAWCSASLSVYPDAACTDPALYTLQVNSLMPKCFDVGGTIASKTMETIVYHPGAPCEPTGGEPVGSATPLAPSTFCCQP